MPDVITVQESKPLKHLLGDKSCLFHRESSIGRKLLCSSQYVRPQQLKNKAAMQSVGA